MRPASRRSRPVTQLKSVVLPEPLGPMRPWIRPASRRSETPLTAVTPPKLFLMPSISSAAAIYSVRGGRASRDIRRSAAAELRAASDRPRQPVLDLQETENPARHEQDDGHDDGAEEELMKVGEARPHHLLRHEQDDG